MREPPDEGDDARGRGANVRTRRRGDVDSTVLAAGVGVILGDERRRLACLAADLQIGDIVEYLSPKVPGARAAPACVAGQVEQEIRDRAAAP